jgi:[acyl-carrier-protein] S-malonyltransferase
MASDVFAARPDLLGPPADAILGWSLSDLCANGPQEELTRTDRAQPALYATAYALWDEFAKVVPHPPVAAAGHSLGEYTALAAAGVFDFETGLRLVAARGAAMGRAAEQEESGMAALLGADEETAERVAAARRDDGGRLYVANLNAPGQVVVAGGADDIEWLAGNGRDLGVRRVIPLDVAGAFHSPFMASAADDLSTALAGVDFSPPRFPIYSNVSAEPVADVGAALAAQLTGAVRFAASLEHMSTAGLDALVHIGPGDVTAGMAKRTVKGLEVLVANDLESVAAVATALVQ